MEWFNIWSMIEAILAAIGAISRLLERAVWWLLTRAVREPETTDRDLTPTGPHGSWMIGRPLAAREGRLDIGMRRHWRAYLMSTVVP
jgi:hypothetical protein